MGWFQRLFSGAQDDDGSNRGRRSPEQARVSAQEFTHEIRALKDEIKALRENLGGGGRDALRGEQDSSRSRRGGRGRGRGGGGDRDGRNERDQQGRGRNEPRRDRTPRRAVPREIPEDAPTGLLVDYLKTRKVVVYEGQDDLDRNEAFEHLARHLGTHFDLLAEFYEKVKRCVATGRGQRIDIDGYSQAGRSAAVQFGTLLHRHGMLKDFYYHRSPKRQLRVIPTKDGQIGQFLTGGWLEIYVFAVLAKRLSATMSDDQFQLLANVKGMLEDGREFEADLMAAVGDKFFWLECKTGNWQDYSARFRGLVKIFGVERTSAGLLLIRPPDSATRKRATDMLDMTLLSLAEVDDFISVFLGEEPTGDSRRHAEAPQLEEEERPRRDARPARRDAESSSEEKPSRDADSTEREGEDGDASPRRRRRRRGGRGRGRSRSAQEASAEGEGENATRDEGRNEDSTRRAPAAKPEVKAKEEALPVILGLVPREQSPMAREKKGSLNEPLPIAKIEEEATAEPSEKSEANSDSSEQAPRRRRRRRTSSSTSPFADDAKSDASEEPSAKKEEVSEEVKAEKLDALADAVAEKVAPKRPRRQPKARGGKPKATVAEEEMVPAAEPEPEAKSEVTAEAKAEPEAEPKAEEKPKPKPKPRAKAAPKPRAKAKPKAEPEAEAEAESDAPQEAEAEAKPKPKPRARAAAKPRAKAKPKAEAEVEAEPKVEAKAEAKPAPKAEPKAKPAPKPKVAEKVEAPEAAKPSAKTTKSGVTIAPDLAAMMAGSKPKKD